jgi:hypothetical protein
MKLSLKEQLFNATHFRPMSEFKPKSKDDPLKYLVLYGNNQIGIGIYDNDPDDPENRRWSIDGIALMWVKPLGFMELPKASVIS